MSTPASTPPAAHAHHLPLRSVLKSDLLDGGDRTTPPSSASSKAVQIAEPEVLPLLEEPQPKKQFTASASRRLSGRPPLASSSSRTSLWGVSINDDPESLLAATASPSLGPADSQQQQQQRPRLDRVSEKLLGQVADWLQHEKAKKANRKKARSAPRRSPRHESANADCGGGEAVQTGPRRPRASSVDSAASDVSLDRLQRILDDGMAAMGLSAIPHFSPELGRRASRRSPHRQHHQHHHGINYKSVSGGSLVRTGTASSDTDYVDGDVVVPACDAVLDNSKTLSYTGGKAKASASGDGVSSSSSLSRREEKEKQAWVGFKNEIIRLAHTLRLKGWRRVPLDAGETISVERLSGALTNAVYVVSPPPAPPPPLPIPSLYPTVQQEDKQERQIQQKPKRPSKVLLRVYGPQVAHLIDRQHELGVLRRLARHKIGPRLLGTFVNGRFEQYFNSVALTPSQLREPETSRQVAKRMRELHDGIELEAAEREGGPVVWKNWDRWVEEVERRVLFLDSDFSSAASSSGRGGSGWKACGFVCGVAWPLFRAMVEKSRHFLETEYYGGAQAIREKLVFAHNDTQYGNILRVRPDDERSPLLQPENEHKQLVVIDFEYAGANVPSLEFANHFTEWTYDYHDRVAPHACRAERYPTPEQQRRFVRAYVDHRTQFAARSSAATSTPGYFPSPSLTATMTATTTMVTATTPGATSSAASSIVDFMLDARAVPPGGWREEEARREEEAERRVQALLAEARLWRVANSAQWVAWGIVQAKIPGWGNPAGHGNGDSTCRGEKKEEEEDGENDDDEFDYLAYAHERALFFWGDCVLLGLVQEEELPAELRGSLKMVPY